MDSELLTYRGYTIEIDKGFDQWAYAVAFGMKSLGRFAARTYDLARKEAMSLIDDDIRRHGGQAATEPTELDLIKLELRDLLASVGEIRLGWNAVMQRLADQEGRIKTLEAKAIDTDRRIYTASIGVGGVLVDENTTVTPPPEFEGVFIP